MAVAPPLILLGAPFRVFMHGLPQWFVREWLAGFLRWSPVQRLGRALVIRCFAGLAATVALIGWHVPAAFELGMRSDGWHEVEYACFFGAGLLFWWPVVQPWPKRRPVAAVVHCFIPFLCHLAVRCAFRVSYLLRPRCISVLLVREPAFRYFTSPGPGVCGRPDVGFA